MRNAFRALRKRQGTAPVIKAGRVNINTTGTEGRISGSHRTQDALARRPGYC
jgi:hypothetical protein